MFTWITENISTIIVFAVLIAVMAIIVLNMIRNKRKGKSACGCGCAECAMKDACHNGR